jgi:hypothetical protein
MPAEKNRPIPKQQATTNVEGDSYDRENVGIDVTVASQRTMASMMR